MKWVKRNDVTVDKDGLLIEQLAVVRGIEDISEWINPPSKYVHSPYLLDNIDELVEVLIKAIHTGKSIVIVADIDTDGVCSASIMYNYLKELTSRVRYIHSQRSKGHGVETVLDQIVEDDEVVLIVDSSSNSVEGCKALKEQLKDVLIIDHHVIDEENPYAIIVNCQQGKYPNKHLSGSAMCYKVCQVLDEYLDIELAEDFLDLSSVGLVGDMMDVSDMENRYLINKGINRIQNFGLKEILNQSGIEFKKGITTTNISFKVAPIIGACSRFDKIELALRLLTCEDEDEAKSITKEMIDLNEERKTQQKEQVESVVESIQEGLDMGVELDSLIVIVDNNIESGFRGLIATEVVEKYSRPTFILSEKVNEDGSREFVGSARSVGLIKLKELCEQSGLFIFATGHSQAHGVGFNSENLDAIISYFNNTLDSTDLQKVVEYDLEIEIDDIDEMDIKSIESFGKIVGQGFPEPTFLINGVIVEEAFSKKLGSHMRAVMGKQLDTVKIICESNFNLMKFRSHENYARDVEEYFYNPNNFITELQVVGSLNLNSFYNYGLKKTVVTSQIFMSDYKIVK